jgi:hypothetical protein
MEIGFQSNEPGNDLRSTGMFSILQILALIDKLYEFVSEIFNFSLKEENYFPFICLLINLSKISLDALKYGYLIPICNKNSSVINTLNEFYFGLVALFFSSYKEEKATIDNINTILLKVKQVSCKNVNKIFKISYNICGANTIRKKDSISFGDINYSSQNL